MAITRPATPAVSKEAEHHEGDADGHEAQRRNTLHCLNKKAVNKFCHPWAHIAASRKLLVRYSFTDRPEDDDDNPRRS
ncbi:hypothetical protein CDV31_002465 [Fusarium ambrosium]|uniref:Uncharacterized protein n=1 Tax=Fusarium ambrosium TaxID=131363 RepID=A0A428UWR8_9HYPO|nr:hypothetical protein CDV31_002465 [Fusarium ambrosium]